MEATAPINETPPPSPAPSGERGRMLFALAMLGLMVLPVFVMLIKGSLPALDSLDNAKEWVNRLSVPEISLPFFFMPIFMLMMVMYREWTKPGAAALILVIFSVAYFGSMLIDDSYYLILKKPDNVPITMMLFFTGLCIWVGFRQAAINDTALAAGRPLPEAGKDDKVLVWPDLVYTEMICLVIATALLVLWSILLRAPLEAPANQAGPPNPSKAPWYFLGLQEMLVYYDPWMAGVVLPGMIITGLIMMPYVDMNPKGNGYYTVRERPFALWTWLFGFLILWVVLIVFGTFLRGPNWNFFGPYEPWNAHTQVPLTSVQFSDYVWNGKKLLGFGLDVGLPTNSLIRELPGILFTLGWVFVLPAVLAKTIFSKLYAQMGFWRYWIMAIHFVVLGLLPLKMFLRWMLTLKYFVYLPEYNLNL